jgi:uncharacterized repeat protein (TIGR03943 family)
VTAAGGAISLLVGTVLLRLTFTGTYRRYVRVGMGPWLAIAGIAVLVLGAVTLWRALRSDDGTEADHDHHGDVRIGWLLLAPIAALLLVAPPTLGSFGVDRGAVVDVRAGTSVFEPLPPGDEPTTMSLLEFGQRAVDHAGASFNDATVRLTGFVAGLEEDGFVLARYQIACCAADAAPVVVQVVGVYGDPPPRDQWVTVTGSHIPGAAGRPSIAATAVVEIPTPDDPYE